MASSHAPPPPGARPRRNSSAAYVARLRDQAGIYFPEMVNPSVHVLEECQRPQSVLLRCEFVAGETRRRVIVKIPIGAGPAGKDAVTDQPRIAPLPDPALKHRMEFVALSAIQRQVADSADPRFGAVRILDLLSDSGATVMEEVEGTPLRTLLNHATRLHPERGSQLLPYFRAAGAWLARFQSLPPHEYCRTRGATRDEFEASLSQFAEWLGRNGERSSRLEDAADVLRRAARQLLPEDLPLGTGHGDFAPRNVLVNGAGQVTVLDTMARFQVPVYEDLAYFLVDLRASRLQALTLGQAYSPRFLDACEQALLEGWAESRSIPLKAVRLFQAQALLDRWCARVVMGRVVRSPRGRGELLLTRLHFLRVFRHLYQEIV